MLPTGVVGFVIDPAVLERLKVVDGGSLKERVETATLTVQAQAALEQQQHIGTRLQAYLTAPGNVTKGQAMFKKQCSQCHQAAGVGAKIAPQLDGIRSRGVARLVEDIVAPNRNVDVAFRTTTIATTDGLVIDRLVSASGLDNSHSKTSETVGFVHLTIRAAGEAPIEPAARRLDGCSASTPTARVLAVDDEPTSVLNPTQQTQANRNRRRSIPIGFVPIVTIGCADSAFGWLGAMSECSCR